MEISTDRFSKAVRQALDDPRLQEVLDKATSRFAVLREAAFERFPEGEALRDVARRIKEETLAGLDGVLRKLTETVTRRGGNIHWAADAAEARSIVLDLARRYGVRLAVKSKSMTTEEISLNEVLEGAGVETVETDLGEYIIQIAGEGPSHIIAPAIHKSKDEVADLFVRKLGSPRMEKHEELTLEARRHLRDKFRRADMGITGANFAVAETGTIVVVENEGNARLTTSLPRVHVAVMGMEKVIPDLSALAVFLKILARSATGQAMSSYVSLVSGPRREGEEDGPEAFHLIVIDNGRSRILADPRLRESLYCIRCGACLNVCPVYRHAGGHAYGWVYSGPIGAVITPSFVGHDRAGELPFASTLCGACRDVCPVRIDIPRLLVVQREKVAASRRLERLAARLFTATMSSRRLYRLASPMSRLLAAVVGRNEVSVAGRKLNGKEVKIASPGTERGAEQLVRELEMVGGVVHRAGSAAEVRDQILKILAERRARRVVRADTPLMVGLELDEALETAGHEVTVCGLGRGESAARIREAEFAADAGIITADYGVAETGTLAVLARPGQGRAVSLLPPLSIVVLREDRIVSELGALFAAVTAEGKDLPSALTFITGPSRTADIELVLTIGVHGPGELHLITVPP